MIKEDRPNLSLGNPPGKLRSKASQPSRTWLRLILVLQIAAIVCLVMIIMRPGVRRNRLGQIDQANAKQLKQLAIELEDRSLDLQAARAWGKYLDAAPDDDDRAEIFYRVGKLYMRAEQFGDAATAFISAEQSAGEDESLEKKIGPNMVECLGRLGLYGEVGRELSRRVAVGADVKSGRKVLATLGKQELTEADLDRLIEQQVDDMLAIQGASGDVAQRKAMLKRFAEPRIRQNMLHELVQIEMFCRRARDLKIDREDEYIKSQRAVAHNMLASRFLERELTKLEPTAVDLEAYYAANRKKYEQPGLIDVRLIQLEKDEDAAKLLEDVKSADDFRKLVEDRGKSDEADTSDEAAKANEAAPEPRRLVQGVENPLLGDTTELFKLDEGKWTSEPHVNGDTRFLVLIEKKTPDKTPELAEIEARVRSEYLTRKQDEYTRKLVRDLMDRYDVRILPPAKPDQEKTP